MEGKMKKKNTFCISGDFVSDKGYKRQNGENNYILYKW